MSDRPIWTKALTAMALSRKSEPKVSLSSRYGLNSSLARSARSAAASACPVIWKAAASMSPANPGRSALSRSLFMAPRSGSRARASVNRRKAWMSWAGAPPVTKPLASIFWFARQASSMAWGT